MEHEEYLYRTLIQTSLDGFWISDFAGNILDVNDALCKMLGYTREELLRLNITDIEASESPEQTAAHIRKIISTGSSRFQNRHRRRDGAVIEVEAHVQCSEKLGERFFAFFRDITARRQAEEALRENEEKFHTLYESSRDAIIMAIPGGGYVGGNQAAIELFGCRDEHEFITLSPDSTSPEFQPDGSRSVDRAREVTQLVLENGKHSFEWLHRRMDGSEFLADVLLTLTRVGGKPVIQASVRDITERRKMEDTMRENNERFDLAVRGTSDGIWDWDIRTNTNYFSPRFLELLGYATDEVEHKLTTFESFLHPEDVAMVFDRVRQHLENKVPYDVEYRMRTKKGDYRWFQARGEAARDKAGKPVRMAGSVSDITDRKKAEEKLRRIEWMLTERPCATAKEAIGQPYGDLTPLNNSRTILDSVGHELLADIVDDFMGMLETSSAIYESNGDYANGIFASGWCRFMDMASRNLCATPDNREALSCGKWLCHESCWNEASIESIRTGQPADVECAGCIRLYAVPIRAGNEIVGSINVGYGDPPREVSRLQELAAKYRVGIEELRREAEKYETRPPFVIELARKRLHVAARLVGEIVQRKRTEKEIRRLNEELEQRVMQRTAQLQAAVTDLENFGYSVSHDLRAPLRAIDGFVGILREDYASVLDEEGQRLFQVVSDNAKKMGRLIDDILAFSRAVRSELRLAALDMNDLAQRVWDELEPGRTGRRMEFRLSGLPSAQGDPAALHQVLQNLLDNAIKFTRERENAVIEVGGHREGAENVYFVRDNGTGFDMDYSARLFGLFQRLHGMGEFEGTGVGLAIVKRFIAKHGGRVWAEGKPGKGATFWFTLPAETNAE